MKTKGKGLREICFGLAGETVIYDNGHQDKDKFLAAIKTWGQSDLPDDAIDSLTVDDVEHTRFSPMSPTQARCRGFDYGVLLTIAGGYPVTMVKL